MVTIMAEKCNSLSQEIYDEYVENVNIYSVTCQHCKCTGTMKRYGFYERRVRFKGKVVKIRIQRICCKECGHTHALLLSIMVPYSQIPLEDQIQIIVHRESSEELEKILIDNSLIDDSEVRRIIVNFDCHWLQPLLSTGLGLLSKSLTKTCIRLYTRQFMQIHQGNVICFLPAT